MTEEPKGDGTEMAGKIAAAAVIVGVLILSGWLDWRIAVAAGVAAVAFYLGERSGNPVTRWLTRGIEAVLDVGFAILIVVLVLGWAVCSS